LVPDACARAHVIARRDRARACASSTFAEHRGGVFVNLRTGYSWLFRLGAGSIRGGATSVDSDDRRGATGLRIAHVTRALRVAAAGNRVVAELDRRGAKPDSIMLDNEARPDRVVVRTR
jgi:hypothetical protein